MRQLGPYFLFTVGLSDTRSWNNIKADSESSQTAQYDEILTICDRQYNHVSLCFVPDIINIVNRTVRELPVTTNIPSVKIIAR